MRRGSTCATIVTLAILVAPLTLAAGQARAAKEKFERNKPHVNIGTIGHVLAAAVPSRPG